MGLRLSLPRDVFGPRNQPFHVALYEELERSGFIEGQNLWVDTQGYGLRVEQLADHASEIVKAQVDIILCVGDAAIRAAQQATKLFQSSA